MQDWLPSLQVKRYEVASWVQEQFNLRMGICAGLVTGSIVCYINYQHGFWAAGGAFLKQFAYNLIMAGYNSRLAEKLATGTKRRWPALLLGAFVPTAVAFAATFSVHFFLETPEPLASTLWQVFPNLIVFFLTGLIFRDKLNEKHEWLQVLLRSKH